MGSVKRAVKKIAKPEVLLPAALLFATGGGSAALGAVSYTHLTLPTTPYV